VASRIQSGSKENVAVTRQYRFLIWRKFNEFHRLDGGFAHSDQKARVRLFFGNVRAKRVTEDRACYSCVRFGQILGPIRRESVQSPPFCQPSGIPLEPSDVLRDCPAAEAGPQEYKRQLQEP
jgi:hypothetical protein